MIELDPFGVEGRREKPFSVNLDIPRTINDAQPYYIFEAKAIDASGATNVEDFLKQRLTMNTVAQTSGEASGLHTDRTGNTSSINLRGVGADKTLVLINGRRMAGVNIVSNTSMAEGQPDLNGIPLSAIERIEVLPSSASGIYGGAALGGVVNVILKRGYQGGEVRATYDNTWDADAPRRRVSLSYGVGLGDGKTHLMFNASWSDTEPLLVADRADIFRENLAGIVARAPATFFDSAGSPFLGRLPNISPRSAAQQTLTFKPEFGGATIGRRTFVPAGTSPSTTPATLGAALVANAGQWDFELPETAQAPSGLRRRFGQSPETKSIQAGIRHQLKPWLELVADYSWNNNESESVLAAGSSAVLLASSPQNPFTSTVTVTTPNPGERLYATRSQSSSAAIGALAEMPAGWTGALDYAWSRNRYEYSRPLSDGAQTNDIASGAMNPFLDPQLYPMDLSPYTGPNDYRSETELTQVSLRGSGPLPGLPWGQPHLTVGLEHRASRTPERTHVEEFPITLNNSRTIRYFANEATTRSAYLETHVPLVKQDWLPLVHRLELQLSGRIERYEVIAGTFSEQTFHRRTPVPAPLYGGPTLNGQPYFTKASYTSDNYTLGLKYQPVPGVILRVSRATAFLPPLPGQLIKNPQQGEFATTVLDPVTGLQTSVFTIGGGNADLKPQNSRSLNGGIVWEPQWRPLRGLRLNAEYYRIEQFDAIGSLNAQAIVSLESVYPDRVTRDATGRITLVDTSLVNLYHRDTEGWDLSAGYALKTSVGNFNLNAVQSIILHLKNQFSQTLPEFDAVGYHPADLGGVTKYKTNVSLDYERDGWMAGWSTRYVSSYRQFGVAGGPNSWQSRGGAIFNSSYITAQGSDSIPSQIYHDLHFGYAFDRRRGSTGDDGSVSNRLKAGLILQAGIRNVFDTVPPLDAFYDSNFYVSPYGDMRLRSYWLSVRKAF